MAIHAELSIRINQSNGIIELNSVLSILSKCSAFQFCLAQQRDTAAETGTVSVSSLRLPTVYKVL